MVRQSKMRTSIVASSAVASLALGLALALSSTPIRAQTDAAAPTTSGSSTGTAQPPAASDLDTDFWVLVRESADPNALQSYLASFPSGKFINEARQKIAVLREQEDRRARVIPSEAPAPPTPSAAASPPENKDLALALQRELKRVGCLSTDADGVWGDKSRTALKEFVRHANLSISGDEPNLAALDAAQTKRARVCPLVCDDDEKAMGDRCVPNTANKPRQVRQQPTQQEQKRAQPQPKRAWAERPERPAAAAPRAPSGSSGSRICFGAGRNEIVSCN